MDKDRDTSTSHTPEECTKEETKEDKDTKLEKKLKRARRVKGTEEMITR